MVGSVSIADFAEKNFGFEADFHIQDYMIPFMEHSPAGFRSVPGLVVQLIQRLYGCGLVLFDEEDPLPGGGF